LGKYHGTLHPGLNIIVPYLDQVRYKLVTKDIILDVQEQEVITKDNTVILTNAIAFIKVTDPIKAVYGVTDFLGSHPQHDHDYLALDHRRDARSTKPCPTATRSRHVCAKALPTKPSTGD
jgi:regulator of protease activity HflC (stomatin/prohibitin superfamily)